MKQTCVRLLAAMLALCALPVHAAFHLFRIDQVYSNATGNVQYVVMREVTGSNGENFWAGQSLGTTSPTSGNKQFMFPTNLPSSATASRSVLIGTAGFAAMGVIAVDYTMPDGFIPTAGGTLSYAGVDQISLPALPTDGATAINRNGASVAAMPTNFAGTTVTITAGGGGGGPDLNQHGLSGSWFEPATSGQGFEIEFFSNLVAPGTAFVSGAWFTYDVAPAGGADHQRWYTFGGNAVSGQTNIAVQLFRNVGGNFNAPPMTAATVVGSGTLSFSQCDSGTLTYTFSDGSGRAGTIPLSRITPNVTCTVGSAPATDPDFALSGNWYDPVTSGQGFVFEVNPRVPVFFFAWYTYAPDGQSAGAAGQRWFTGQGSYTPGSRTMMLTLYESTGGIFDQPTPVGQSTNPVGATTVTFISCTSAQLQFNFTAGSNAGRSGTIALSRVGPTPPGCVEPASMSTAPPPGMGYPPYGP